MLQNHPDLINLKTKSKMKTPNVLSTVVAIVMLALNAEAKGGENRSVSTEVSSEITTQIRQNLAFTQFNQNLMGENEVILEFSINAQQELVIESVLSENGFLARHVEKVLNGQKVYTAAEKREKTYRLKLKFI
jgi:hypothetical protein